MQASQVHPLSTREPTPHALHMQVSLSYECVPASTTSISHGYIRIPLVNRKGRKAEQSLSRRLKEALHQTHRIDLYSWIIGYISASSSLIMFCRSINPGDGHGVDGLCHALDGRDAGLQLHRLGLPPSPLNPDDPVHRPSERQLSYSQSQTLTPQPSTFGSRSPSTEPVSWQLASAQPSTPISLDGFDSSPEYQQSDFDLSPLFPAGFSTPGSSDYQSTLMTGLGTPPHSSNTELEHRPHPYTHACSIVPGDYSTGTIDGRMYDPSYGQEAPRDIPFDGSSASHHSPGAQNLFALLNKPV
jgi:hypothetical protein